MEQNELLSALLKSKANRVKKSDDLIDEFLKQNTKTSREELNKALINLLIFINENINLDMKILSSLVTSKISAIGISAKPLKLEELYKKMGDIISFDEIDVASITAMRNNFYWVKKEFNAKLQDKLKNITEKVFNGEIPREQMAGTLKDEFDGLIDMDINYFEGVSDHIVSQAQNIARVNQARKYDVEYYEVTAIIDDKTSEICRSMNGRIIPAKHIEKQVDNVVNAKNIADKKAAAAWLKKPFYGKNLPSNVGLPPYHFRCRTEIIPAWVEEEEIDSVKMRHTGRSKDEIIKHIDKTGVIRVLKKSNTHIFTKHKDISHKTIINALNSINTVAPKKGNKSKINAYCDNGCFLAFDGNNIVTCFKPDNKKKYFKDDSLTTEQEIIKRWF